MRRNVHEDHWAALWDELLGAVENIATDWRTVSSPSL